LTVVGLGTQDSLGEAREFVTDSGTQSFTMLWDESFETWLEIGVTSQPSAVLLAANGTPILGWTGPYPEDEVLRLAAESTAGAAG